jgi:hypothetical protein
MELFAYFWHHQLYNINRLLLYKQAPSIYVHVYKYLLILPIVGCDIILIVTNYLG